MWTVGVEDGLHRADHARGDRHLDRTGASMTPEPPVLRVAHWAMRVAAVLNGAVSSPLTPAAQAVQAGGGRLELS